MDVSLFQAKLSSAKDSEKKTFDVNCHFPHSSQLIVHLEQVTHTTLWENIWTTAQATAKKKYVIKLDTINM